MGDFSKKQIARILREGGHTEAALAFLLDTPSKLAPEPDEGDGAAEAKAPAALETVTRPDGTEIVPASVLTSTPPEQQEALKKSNPALYWRSVGALDSQGGPGR